MLTPNQNQASTKNIGFIGIGNMGLPMSLNLQKNNHSVTIYDASPQCIQHASKMLKQAKINIAESIEQITSTADIIITMLPNGEIVSQVWQSILKALPSRNQQILLIDCSTIDIETSLKIHQIANEHSALSLDAPVSGGVNGAQNATLTFMCGGHNQAFKIAQPILQNMGKNIFHCGHNSMGQAAKICNNMMLAPQMIAVCEAFVLAQKLGLQADKLFQVSSVSSGQCWSLTSYCPYPNIVKNTPSNNNYKPGFSAELMLKDLTLSQQAAQNAKINTPFAAKATEFYQQLVNKKGKNIDFSAALTLIQELNDS